MRRIGLYLHWPFCQAKCPYCDFNSHVVAAIDHDQWRRAYAAEIARHAALLPDVEIGSIFFGGGTPSLMEARTVAEIIDGVQRSWRLANDVEITLEANPTSVEAERFRDYRMAGVNRVSVGIQALNDTDLRRLGRLHSVAEARAAFDVARATFDRTSFDLIYARQHQSAEDWAAELRSALAMAADHLSLYQLTVEDGTAFGDRLAAGRLGGLPDEDRGADLWQITQDLTAAAGLPAYEISNHARPGAESRHNLIYWTGKDYVGIGPGAHGRLTIGETRYETVAVSSPVAWLRGALSPEAPESRTPLSPRAQAEERLMMGLRIAEGVPLHEVAVPDARLEPLEEIGLVERTCGHLRLTAAGRPLLNAILREMLA